MMVIETGLPDVVMIETTYPGHHDYPDVAPSAPPAAAVPPVPVPMEAPLFEEHVVLGELLDEPSDGPPNVPVFGVGGGFGPAEALAPRRCGACSSARCSPSWWWASAATCQTSLTSGLSPSARRAHR